VPATGAEEPAIGGGMGPVGGEAGAIAAGTGGSAGAGAGGGAAACALARLAYSEGSAVAAITSDRFAKLNP